MVLGNFFQEGGTMTNTEDKRVLALKAAQAEARRFIERADEAIEHLTTPETDWVGKTITPHRFPYSSRKFASAKRSSLDLADVLINLRKVSR